MAVAAAGMAVAQAPQPAAAQTSAPQEKLYSNEQLEQMMAPIALYPDSLLSQILMACTYPSDVAEAAAWSAQNKDAKGDDAVKMVQDKNWDPSVMSLVAFPQVLAQLKDQPDWVQKTGDAFLAQSKDVMDAIQRLRAKAQKSGNLKSNEQQKVVVQQAPPPDPGTATQTNTTNTTVIQIEPTNPQTVYVPSYNPTQVYGAWAYPSYPPPYWPPPPYYYPMGGALATGLMFGAGIAITSSLWGGCNWGHGDVTINANRYNNINTGNNRINGGGNQNWNHNANNRRGTPYADQGNRNRNGQADRAGANSRQASRGRDSGGAANLQSGGAANRQGGGAANRQGASAGSRSAGGGSSGGSRGSGSSAFSGASSPGASQRSASRGSSSMSSRGGGGAGRSASRSAPSRGGGGGRRR
jgi:hypothetical protein